jgi:hypothetical protein
MSISLLVEYDDGMDYRRDEVRKQLEKLIEKPPKYLSVDTKKAIRTHFFRFNFTYHWTEDGEELIRKAQTEQWIEAERKNRREEFEQFEIEPWIDDHTKKLWDLAEDWEKWLDKIYLASTYKWRRDANWIGDRGATHHRAGLKRDKTEFWNRPQPTKHRQIKHLAKQKMRQNDNQPQE